MGIDDGGNTVVTKIDGVLISDVFPLSFNSVTRPDFSFPFSVNPIDVAFYSSVDSYCFFLFYVAFV